MISSFNMRHSSYTKLLISFITVLAACACRLFCVPVPNPNLYSSTSVPMAKKTPTKLATRNSGLYPTEVYNQAPTRTPAPVVDSIGEIARSYLEDLAQDIGPRLAGSDEEAQAAQFIQEVLEEAGYYVEKQSFSFSSEGENLDSANLVAIKAGESARQIIVGAHYDSVDDGSGADDNASGVAVMLEVAESIIDLPTPYSVVFIAFGAEEEGLYGSNYYVDQMEDAQIQNTLVMINLESVIAGDIPYVYGVTGSKGFMRDWILQMAHEEGFFEVQTQPAKNLDYPDGSPCDCSDYSPFEYASIPFAFFEAANWNAGEKDGETQVETQYGAEGMVRHTRYDRISYIDKTFPGRIDEHLALYITLLYNTLTQFSK